MPLAPPCLRRVAAGKPVGTLMLFENDGGCSATPLSLESIHWLCLKSASSRIRARSLLDEGRKEARKRRVPLYLHMLDVLGSRSCATQHPSGSAQISCARAWWYVFSDAKIVQAGTTFPVRSEGGGRRGCLGNAVDLFGGG